MRTILMSCLAVLLVTEAFARIARAAARQQAGGNPHAGARRHLCRLDGSEHGALRARRKEHRAAARAASNGQRAGLVAWKGGAKLYRAVLALEAGTKKSSRSSTTKPWQTLDEAKKLGPKNPGVAAVVGGSYLTFGDRLPEELRANAWNQAYDNYQILWSQQGKMLERLPVHIRGELLAGLVQSAQRTGRAPRSTTSTWRKSSRCCPTPAIRARR